MRYPVSKIQVFIQRVQTLNRAVQVEIDQYVSNRAESIVKIVRDRVQQEGKDEDGQDIEYKFQRLSEVGKVYTKNYERFKRKRGGQINYVDMTLTGEYMSSLRLVRKRVGVFEVTSPEELHKYMIARYGDNWNGLSLEEQMMFIEVGLRPHIENFIEKHLTKL